MRGYSVKNIQYTSSNHPHDCPCWLLGCNYKNRAIFLHLHYHTQKTDRLLVTYNFSRVSANRVKLKIKKLLFHYHRFFLFHPKRFLWLINKNSLVYLYWIFCTEYPPHNLKNIKWISLLEELIKSW